MWLDSVWLNKWSWNEKTWYYLFNVSARTIEARVQALNDGVAQKKLWLVFMILFNKSTATTGRNREHVCTVKTTLCRLFIFRFVRPKQLSTRKKKRGEKMKCESQHRIKNKSWVLWSLVSVENINFRVLWQFWFNLRRHATYSGAEYMVLLQLSFILHLMMEILEANSQPNWESSVSHFTFQQQHKKYRFA